MNREFKINGVEYISKDSISNENFCTNQSDYVNLYLPSLTLWARCNVNANNETEAGDYFSWGDTNPNKHYTWMDYLFQDKEENSICLFTKYNNEDRKIELEKDDDAATQIMGEEWEIPTAAQYQELFNEQFVEHFVVKNYKNSGIDGMLFKSKRENHMDEDELFIPFYHGKAHGVCIGSFIGKCGTYITKNRDGNQCSCENIFSALLKENGETKIINFSKRQMGYPVRAVKKQKFIK